MFAKLKKKLKENLLKLLPAVSITGITYEPEQLQAPRVGQLISSQITLFCRRAVTITRIYALLDKTIIEPHFSSDGHQSKPIMLKPGSTRTLHFVGWITTKDMAVHKHPKHFSINIIHTFGIARKRITLPPLDF